MANPDCMESVERNDIFDLAYRFITETQESIFLTGKAGTGKTTFLKYLRNHSAKNMIVAAPTGVAAINAGGVTLHSLFQLPLHPFLPTQNSARQLLQGIRYNKQRISLLLKMELLVIDEISMVRCDVIDAIDTILKSVRRNQHEPFGGVQLLFIGDLYQLPPVARNEEWRILNEYYASPFFFDSKAVKEQTPLLIELNKIYRQKEEGFVRLLNKVRNNQLDEDDYEDLNLRFFQHFQPSTAEKYITLTSHNNQADSINQVQLQRLIAPAFTFTATIEEEFPENIFPAEMQLVLKEGAQVMFIKNDIVERKFFNGKIGVVSRLAADKIWVECDGKDIEVGLETWDYTRYKLNSSTEQLERQVLGRFHQYPLRLAWAITIHKSQGLTFDKIMIDAAASFSSGQVYVALSRCTSLDGIVLLSKIPPAAIRSNELVVNGQAALTPKGSLAERFEGARQLFTIQLLSELFLMQEINNAAQTLHYTVQQQIGKLNAEVGLPWLQNFIALLSKEKMVAEKFMAQVQTLMREESVIESNAILQKRVQDAAGYFLSVLNNMKTNLQQHPLVTEHKEAAAAIDENLLELLVAFNKAIYFIQYCKEAFNIANFLKHKLNLTIPRMHISSYAANKKQVAATDIANPELYYTLKNWRDKICETTNLAIFYVASNSNIKEVCTYLPLNTGQLQLLSGFGKSKAEKYGDEIIAMVTDYCNQNGIESSMELKEEAPKKKRKETGNETGAEKIPSNTISLKLYEQGKTIVEIAGERKLAASTIESHLVQFIKTGDLAVTGFMNEAKVELIVELINSHPEKPHGELRSMLGDEYSFTEIRAVANHLLWLKSSTV